MENAMPVGNFGTFELCHNYPTWNSSILEICEVHARPNDSLIMNSIVIHAANQTANDKSASLPRPASAAIPGSPPPLSDC